jgi:hypothetical protein
MSSSFTGDRLVIQAGPTRTPPFDRPALLSAPRIWACAGHDARVAQQLLDTHVSRLGELSINPAVPSHDVTAGVLDRLAHMNGRPAERGSDLGSLHQCGRRRSLCRLMRTVSRPIPVTPRTAPPRTSIPSDTPWQVPLRGTYDSRPVSS